MAQPVYKVFFLKYRESWYKLAKEEQDKLIAMNVQSLKQVGAEGVVLNFCAWSSEEWLAWGVEKYPDIEAVQQHVMTLFNNQWFQYVDSKTYLGTELPQG